MGIASASSRSAAWNSPHPSTSSVDGMQPQVHDPWTKVPQTTSGFLLEGSRASPNLDTASTTLRKGLTLPSQSAKRAASLSAQSGCRPLPIAPAGTHARRANGSRRQPPLLKGASDGLQVLSPQNQGTLESAQRNQITKDMGGKRWLRAVDARSICTVRNDSVMDDSKFASGANEGSDAL